MALQSEAPLLGEAHNTFDGDQKSEEDTEDDVDLEEGEILDSGAEVENEIDIKPNLADLIKNSPKRSPNKTSKVPESTELSGINDVKPLLGSGNIKIEGKFNRLQSERYFKNYGASYVDHDRMSGGEDVEADRKKWFERIHPKKSHDANEPMDYRKELAAYRGSDISSPEHGEKSDKKKKRKSKSRKLTEAKRKKMLEKKRKRGKEMSHRIVRKPCKYWDEGHCNKGPECPYQHNTKFQKKEICRYYISGCCRKMDTCPFMHHDFPCKFFHTGAKCFSGDKCRFSHDPLTEEKRKILHDYLKAHHGDDYHHDKPLRKREREKERTPVPEVPQKRICLLGSPPRHIKEAEETKRWQEEMVYLQREQKIDAFQIHLNFPNQMPPLNNRSKPNFYTDTLASPVKSMPPNKGFGGMNNLPPSIGNMNNLPPLIGGMNNLPPSIGGMNNLPPSIGGMNNLPPSIMGCHINTVNDRFGMPPGNHIPQDIVNWKNIRSLIDGIEAPQNNSGFDRNDEMTNTERGSFNTNMLYPNTPMANDASDDGDNTAFEDEDEEGSRDFKPLKINQEVLHIDLSSSPKELVDESSQVPVAELPDPEPIIIPNHLPRKQRELMLRIQKHQKLKSTMESDDLQIVEDKTESESDNEDIQIVETKDRDMKKWDSSDDDDDEPLTSVLQRLNQTAPPPQIPPTELRSDISQMVTSILQKANENRSGSVNQDQNKFWEDILSGTVPPVRSELASSITKPTQRNLATEDGKSLRRVLLPNPEIQSSDKPKVDIRDPRLKSRDPRTAAAPVSLNNNNNGVKPEILNTMPLSILPLDVSSGRHSVNPHHKDVNSLIPNQVPAAIVEGLQSTAVPYRLQKIVAKPLNYSTYVQASHSDPKLLNDPRLRRLLAQGNTIPSPTNMEKFIISVPKPNSILPELPLFTNLIVETNPAPPTPKQDSIPVEMPSLPEIQLPELQPPQLSRMNDPRTRRIEQRRSSASNVPPPLAVNEPHIPISIIPTFSKSSAVPTPASHLPRSMADPRMANLHNRLDPRRTRTMSDTSTKILKKQPLELKKPALSITQPDSQPSELEKHLSLIVQPESQPPDLKKPALSVTQPESQPPELEKPALPITQSELQPAIEQQENKPNYAKVKPSEEKPKKNKAVHRNRKTSMDYASPLNSCDDSRSSDKLKYNSYTKRPRKPALNSPSRDSPTIEVKSAPVPITIGSPVIPEFLISDSSNVDSDSMDSNLASLKDVFKTKDPTASPFC